jgi:hypothetical protein
MDSTSYLAQHGEVMFERNIALIASRKQEVQVFSDSFVYEGFLCGLDEKWVQIYGHEESNKNNPEAQWRFILIGKDKISAIGPTGRYVNDLDDSVQEWVSKKTDIFSDVCEKYISKRKSKNDNGREERV